MAHPVAEANESSPFGTLTPDEFYSRHSVSHSSEHITNPRGLKLFTQWWTPLPPAPTLGTVCVVHGYTGESSWTVQLTAVLIAKSGFAVCAIDHQGHGFSDGLDGLILHIPDINPVVDDCISFFDSFRSKFDPSLPSFLYSESLGGAIALLITLRRQGRPYDGVVLNGAMCGISDKFKPQWPLEHLLSLAAAVIPKWRVVPTRGSIPDVSFKVTLYPIPKLNLLYCNSVTFAPHISYSDPYYYIIVPFLHYLNNDVEWKRSLAIASPNRSIGNPRAATAQELMRICKEVQSRFEEVDLPFLIVHGGDDVVCDPACVEELYRRASSKDKTIKIYPGMWHQLVGEPDESVDLVFGDVVEWLKSRAQRATKGSA
ncbi:hypothetical protein V2J09_008334 [Rumex salicifolius]